jgi:thioredoxin 1
MKQTLLLWISFFALTDMVMNLMACKTRNNESAISNYSENNNIAATRHKVTFIELGSVKCIPCREMQKVIKAVESKYGDEVETIFYDVWTKEGRPYADLYKINLIPVQVFLDENGKEFFRHEGYYPEEELVAMLALKGIHQK